MIADFLAELERLDAGATGLVRSFSVAFNRSFAEVSAPAAPKQKKCTKGVWCKNKGSGSCISAAKICRQRLTPTQAKQVKMLRRLIRAGDPNASQKLDALRQTVNYIPDRSNRSGVDRFGAAQASRISGRTMAQAGGRLVGID